MPSFRPVIALSRGLEVLRVINQERQSTVGSLHKATGLNKATIVRMLETLEHEGYVVRRAEPPSYAPTGRALLLSAGYDEPNWIGGIAEPMLNKFRQQIQWPSDVAVLDQESMVIAHTTRIGGSLLFHRPPGFRFPVLGTSMGRAYLAFCEPAEQERIAARLALSPEPWNDLARNPAKLTKVLRAIRKAGFAVMDESYSRRIFGGAVWAIGVPVAVPNRLFASMNVMMLREAVSTEEGLRRFVPQMKKVASALAETLSARLAAQAHPRPPRGSHFTQ
ncbi:helix-turn-helix domain-containing protein [Bradyrhizobium yuanmingense]|uniref:helix-turn-helix domain-containing protein n=1 Tax=Bradyrhizobium yuanmingense TaxID=108015 RepID=UPI0023B9DEAC|nr:helix-turn-helix domain-containing protein [Bradyrhizobium yuanmingense]MDF0498670.1 helix-turn-helix domain-containing protein [Bradyrhizobium yuanmingense]